MFHKTRILTLAITWAALASVALPLLGFALKDSRWPAGEVAMEMQLGSSGGLRDGSADWDECAIAALIEWNNNLGGTGISFNAVRGSTRTPAENDRINSVFFSDEIFGDRFPENVLAVATAWVITREGIDERTESDVIFNNAKAFNCFRGPLSLGPTPEPDGVDLKRVALHEFGHTIGLLHPDQATPPQTVEAIMNAFLSDTDTLQLDDIQGALTLYGVAVTGIPFPPRNEALDFYLSLENLYRDFLGRQQNNPGNVNAEGIAVWLPEFLRYVLNGCSAPEASARVLLNIASGSIQPVCGVVAPGVFNFPPRNVSVDFLTELDAYYGDELNETAPNSYIDPEGKAVWLEVYLGYRVNGCNNQEATDRAFAQIRTGVVAPACAT